MLTESEYAERAMLLRLQKSTTRYMRQEDFDRLHDLSKKMATSTNVILTKEDIRRLANDNIGAAAFLSALASSQDDLHIFIRAIKKADIKGTSIYVLWKDLANEDFARLNQICRNVPSDKLREACAKQDRTGIDIIKTYITI